MRRRAQRARRGGALLAAVTAASLLSPPVAAGRETYEVRTGGDHGRGSFREAVQKANRNRGPDKIKFAPGLDRVTLRRDVLVEESVDLSSPRGADRPEIVAASSSGAGAAPRLKFGSGRGRNQHLEIRRVDFRGVGLSASRSLFVRRSTLEGLAPPPLNGVYTGIRVRGGPRVALEQVRVRGYERGIWVAGTEETLIWRATISANDVGVRLVETEAELDESTVMGNRSGVRAGRRAGTTIVESLISDNAPAGGIKAGTLRMTSSTVAGNEAPAGGGVVLNDGEIVNSTISGNVATGGPATSLGGGILVYDPSAHLNVTSSTVTGNEAAVGAGVFAGTYYYDRRTRIENSIVAGNVGEDCGAPVNDDSSLVSRGGNVFGPTGCGEATLRSSDAVVPDPLLGPLADNGGPTPTHALLDGSPAIGRALPGGPDVDQRGLPRGDDPDSGSYERQP